MRYIKLFESWKDVELYYDNLLEEVKDFTEQSLAYLVDDGWELNFELNNTTKLVNYMYPTDSKLVVISMNLDEEVSWDSIKDKILPFLQLLERRYKLEDSSRNRSDKPYVMYDGLTLFTFSLKDLLSGKKTKSLFTDKIVIRIDDKI